jgi:hypothetical protein
MLYGNEYEGRRRGCENCGHFTNVHTYCHICEMTVCEGCEDDHTCVAKCGICDDRSKLNVDGLCAACAADEAAEKVAVATAAAEARERLPFAPKPCVQCKKQIARWDSIYCSGVCKQAFLGELRGEIA